MTDVWGLDPDLLQMVPSPVKALILLFPMTEASEKFMTKRAEELNVNEEVPSSLFYTRQTVSNACGTVALLHAVGNSGLELDQGSALEVYFKDTKPLTAEDRGTFLETCEPVATLHKTHAETGNSTETPALEDEAEHHFIAFINHNGSLWELDGRKQRPIRIGPTNNDNFLKDAAKECSAYMTADKENMKFSVMAFTGGVLNFD